MEPPPLLPAVKHGCIIVEGYVCLDSAESCIIVWCAFVRLIDISTLISQPFRTFKFGILIFTRVALQTKTKKCTYRVLLLC